MKFFSKKFLFGILFFCGLNMWGQEETHLISLNLEADQFVTFTDLSIVESDFYLDGSIFRYYNNALTWGYTNNTGNVYNLNAKLQTVPLAGWTYKIELTGIASGSGEKTLSDANQEVVTALPANTTSNTGLETLTIEVDQAYFTTGNYSNTILFTLVQI